MDLALRDQKLHHVKCELRDRKKKLFNKLLVLQKNVKENKFLEGIVDDYGRYYDYMVRQKTEQLEAFKIISEYLNKITLETELTDAALERAKDDQSNILREMNYIKEDLDEIISTGNIE